MGTSSALVRADALHRSGDHAGSLAAAREGLSQAPDDVALLRVAARCSAELGLDESPELFRRLVELAPGEPEGWADLGTALLDRGLVAEAAQAFRTVLHLRPDDMITRVNLAHALYAIGDRSEAITLLTDAAGADPGNVNVARSLVEMLRRADEPLGALEKVRGRTGQLPDDPVILLDLAELQLAARRLDDALATYRRLAGADDEGHRIYAWHGMIGIEIQRDQFRRALDLAIEATALDRHQLTTDLLAFVAARLFGESDHPVRPWPELLDELASEQAQHRCEHLEALVA